MVILKDLTNIAFMKSNLVEWLGMTSWWEGPTPKTNQTTKKKTKTKKTKKNNNNSKNFQKVSLAKLPWTDATMVRDHVEVVQCKVCNTIGGRDITLWVTWDIVRKHMEDIYALKDIILRVAKKGEVYMKTYRHALSQAKLVGFSKPNVANREMNAMLEEWCNFLPCSTCLRRQAFDRVKVTQVIVFFSKDPYWYPFPNTSQICQGGKVWVKKT